MPAGPSTTQAVIPGPTLTAAPSPATTVAKGIQALLGCKVGQLVLRSMDRALDTSEEWLDRCLPLPDRVLGTEGLLALPPPPCSKPGCLLRLSALSSSLRNRALALALSKLQRTRRNVRQSLSQLHQTVDLVRTNSPPPPHPTIDWARTGHCLHPGPALPSHPPVSAAQVGTDPPLPPSPISVPIPHPLPSVSAPCSPLQTHPCPIPTLYSARAELRAPTPLVQCCPPLSAPDRDHPAGQREARAEQPGQAAGYVGTLAPQAGAGP